MKRLLFCIAFGSLVLGSTLAATPPAAISAPPLRPAVQAHLAAIAARNMDALLPTLTTRAELAMIAPNGYKFDTQRQYIDFHRQWFATNDHGKLDAQIVRLIESPALGHALIKYRYTSDSAAGTGQTITAWLALTFALENGTWRLVFDQNTLIADPANR